MGLETLLFCGQDWKDMQRDMWCLDLQSEKIFLNSPFTLCTLKIPMDIGENLLFLVIYRN